MMRLNFTSIDSSGIDSLELCDAVDIVGDFLKYKILHIIPMQVIWGWTNLPVQYQKEMNNEH